MKSASSDVAYEFLKKRILGGEYPPGTALLTEALALEIGISRTPLRDALLHLEADGLVIVQARAGARVKQMDLREFREMCELRLALESHAAGLAARNRTEFDLREIGQALEGMRRLTQEMTGPGIKYGKLLAELVKEDVRFHLSIISAAKSELLKKEILRLHLIDRVVAAPLADSTTSATREQAGDARWRAEVLAGHDEVFQAIRRADAPEATEAMERHLEDLIDRNLRSMVRNNPSMVTRARSEEEAIYNA